MTNEQIKAIFLAAGFKERDQGEGRMDLNPYVYDGARALLTAQLAEMGWFPCSPELLESGVCCATAPRVLGGQGYSHYHQAVAKPAWYEHTLRNERGHAIQTGFAGHQTPVFGKPDVDYDKLFSVSVVPLFKHADPGEYAQLGEELAQCEAMAAMVAEREWAEHVGIGPVSSKVETAFTQLHNELHIANEKLAALLAAVDAHREALKPLGLPLGDRLEGAVLSASAEPISTAWRCEPCKIEMANKRPCDLCGAEPSAPKCKYCGDTGQIMVGRSGDANDGNAPIMEACEDCIPDFTPGNGNKARRRAEELGIDYNAATCVQVKT